MNPESIVEKLASFKDRACAGPNEKPVLDYLEAFFLIMKLF